MELPKSELWVAVQMSGAGAAGAGAGAITTAMAALTLTDGKAVTPAVDSATAAMAALTITPPPPPKPVVPLCCVYIKCATFGLLGMHREEKEPTTMLLTELVRRAIVNAEEFIREPLVMKSAYVVPNHATFDSQKGQWSDVSLHLASLGDMTVDSLHKTGLGDLCIVIVPKRTCRGAAAAAK